MKAVVMAGGFGARIQPLTSSRPKPMLPIVNIPMMEHIMKNLISLGIEEFVILLYYKPDVIRNYFGDGSRLGVKINYVLPEADFGTAGAVKKAQRYLDDTFIVVSGDIITDFDLREVVGFHEFKSSKLTIVLTSVPNPLQFGIVITDREGRILKFLEKPSWGEVFSDAINTGIYVIEPEVLDSIPENVPFDFSRDLFPLLMERGIELYGFKAAGYWRDIGNPDAYRDVHKDILHGKLRFHIPGKLVKYPDGMLFLQDNVSIPDSLKVRGAVVLANGVEVGERTSLENCSIGKNTRIGRSCQLNDAVIWEDTVVEDDTKLRNCVICNHVEIGSRVEALKGAVIAEKVKVESNVHIERDVVIWPDKFVESGSIVSTNLVWGEKWKRSIFEGGKVSGRINVELSPELASKLGAALGTILPKGSFVFMSRDYHRASRMIKESFLSGLLSSGINVVDLKKFPSPAARFLLQKCNFLAGVHFEASSVIPGHTDILFFDGNGLPIDTAREKSIERVFFKERFRRVTPSEVGIIKEKSYASEEYIRSIKKRIDDKIKQPGYKIVVDLMNGIFSEVYPKLLAHFKADSIILNSYESEEKLTHFPLVRSKALRDIPRIVKSTEADIGFVIHPEGEKLSVVSDKGEVIEPHRLILLFIKAIDEAVDKHVKVCVPVSCPSVFDEELKNVSVERKRFRGISDDLLRQYYMVGDLDRRFSFPEFSLSPDGVYASVKLLELLSFAGKSVSQILDEIPEFFFSHLIVNCPSSRKAKLMRNLSEEAFGKTASFIEGVKIFGDENWILFIPDQFADRLHIFVQAKTKKDVERILKSFQEKLNRWIEEG
ncbi:MAG: NTP transferase domain-containing protein [Nitrospiraceae bacterium]|nr:NTP transferase domain-containing protein [Nitrospiraceae bacterium]